MLKKLTIRNFKAIQYMTIEFTPFTVLVGANACGKSTVLQALDFLRVLAFRDIPEYLNDRDWRFDDLKSQIDGDDHKPIEFIATWDNLEWHISIDWKEKWLIKERVMRKSDGACILSYHDSDYGYSPDLLKNLYVQSSAMKLINTDELQAILSFLSDSADFELLSPEKIRSGKKDNYAQGIGLGGEALFYCIHKMSNTVKDKLDVIVSDLLDTSIHLRTVDFVEKIELFVEEYRDGKTIKYNSLHTSDGMLRIIAYAAISLETINPINHGMILLDEIEDGINPYLTEKVVNLIFGILKNMNRQIIVTTHSPIVLDFVNPDEVVFMWKSATGASQCEKLFKPENMRESLGFLNPGEVWYNYGKDEIISRLTQYQQEQQ
jgi:predicted ATPase